MKKFLTTVAMCGTMFSPLASTAAYADTIPAVTADAADGDTLADMDQQCDALAALHDTHNGDVWTANAVPGAVTPVSGPTEVGTHSVDEALPGTLHGAGSFAPAHIEIMGDPFRNGGSVNMFGIQQSVGGHYSASTYDYSGDFVSVYAHAFSCDISRAVFTPGNPRAGHYVVHPSEHGNDDAGQQACTALNNIGETWPNWTENTQQCDFIATPIAELTGPAELYGNEAGGVVNQEQSDALVAYEDAGEGYDTSETLIIGQVVVCISPTLSTSTKKGAPGTWKQQNGYTGDKCTTAWYNGGATAGVPNLNDGSHNYVTVPVV